MIFILIYLVPLFLAFATPFAVAALMISTGFSFPFRATLFLLLLFPSLIGGWLLRWELTGVGVVGWPTMLLQSVLAGAWSGLCSGALAFRHGAPVERRIAGLGLALLGVSAIIAFLPAVLPL